MRVVLVHGSVGNGDNAWAPVRSLAERYELVVPNRGGYPPGPLLGRIDFDEQAAELAPLLADEAHLVGHSYGGVIALLMAARRPEAVYSLTVSEPPAFAIARGNPEVERLVGELAELFEAGESEPAEFLRRFGAIVGSTHAVPDPLPADLEDHADNRVNATNEKSDTGFGTTGRAFKTREAPARAYCTDR